jgi:putative transposase
MVDFKGSHYPKDVILYAVFFYVRYAVSCRDLEEIMAERGVNLDHATLNRWVVKYSPLIALRAKRRKSKPGGSWRMDETSVALLVFVYVKPRVGHQAILTRSGNVC